MFEDYDQCIKSGKGGGGGPPAELLERERDLKKDLEQSKVEFAEQTKTQEARFTSRLTQLQESSTQQVDNLRASFGQQLNITEASRKALASQNKDLSARIGAAAVGASKTGAKEVKTTSPVSIFSGVNRSRGRASNILASGSGRASNPLGSQIVV